MNIEDKIFRNKRFNSNKAINYGFKLNNTIYTYEIDFMNDFHLIFTYDTSIHTNVIDLVNDEEYYPLKSDSYIGNYVSKVRETYQNILIDICENCFDTVYFYSDQANRITDKIYEIYNVKIDFPFKDKRNKENGTFKHINNKWFGIIMEIPKRLLTKDDDTTIVNVLNVKINKEDLDSLLTMNGIYEAYHMHHKLWISIILDDTLSDEEVLKHIRISYHLTNK